MIRVVNVRGVRATDRGGIVYCGRPCAGWRGHPLANPFRLDRAGSADPAARAEVLARYRAWLLARPTLDADLADLWAACGGGAKALGCWCAPLSCHADVLAELLTERYGGGVSVTDDDGEPD